MLPRTLYDVAFYVAVLTIAVGIGILVAWASVLHNLLFFWSWISNLAFGIATSALIIWRVFWGDIW